MFSQRCNGGFETCRMWSLVVGWMVCNISKKYIAFVLKGQVLTLENEYSYIPHIPKEQNP